MKQTFKYLLGIILALLIFSLATLAVSPQKVELIKINEKIWVHRSYAIYNGYNTPSNGLIVEIPGGLLLVDTPWNDKQTEELISLVNNKLNSNFTMALITHAHEDRMGGIKSLISHRIPVISSTLTAQRAKELGFASPQFGLDFSENVGIRYNNTLLLECYYPGPGHTIDNMVVWFPTYKLLFAGCLVKAGNATTIGNTAEADLQQWPISLQKLLSRYPEAEIVVPGHGDWGGKSLITHTLDLLKQDIKLNI